MLLMFKALIGVAIVLLIEVLTKSKYYFIAGMIPLFPAFALLSHYTIGTQRSVADLKDTVLFSILSLLPYFIFLAMMYFFAGKISLQVSLVGAVFCWGLVAGVLIYVWR